MEMKVSIMVEVPRWGRDGAERVLLSLISGFKKEGWYVKFIQCSKPDSPRYEDIASYFESNVYPDEKTLETFPVGLLSRFRRYLFYRRVLHNLEDYDAIVRLAGYPWFPTLPNPGTSATCKLGSTLYLITPKGKGWVRDCITPFSQVPSEGQATVPHSLQFQTTLKTR